MRSLARWGLIVATGALLCACDARNEAPVKLAADVSFRCLWWSPAQMENLNPNAPPPKTTEVTIQKWEYSDPVGVPHPDSVDVVVALKDEGGATKTPVSMTVSGQWRVGPLKNEARAEWTQVQPLKTFDAVALASAQPVILRVPVDVAGRMSTLEKNGEWPWAFRAIVTVSAPGMQKPLFTREAELPIRPGD
jgi:hypothetical protein